MLHKEQKIYWNGLCGIFVILLTCFCIQLWRPIVTYADDNQSKSFVSALKIRDTIDGTAPFDD